MNELADNVAKDTDTAEWIEREAFQIGDVDMHGAQSARGILRRYTCIILMFTNTAHIVGGV